MENNGHCKFNRMVDCSNHECFNCGWNPDIMQERVNEWKKNHDDFYWDLLMEQHEQM